MKFKKTLFSLILSGAIVFTNVVSYGSDIKDIDFHWSRFYVERLEKKGIINGYVENNEKYFFPDSEITREEVSTIISKFLKGQGGESSLKDIENRWSTPYIKYLLDRKIIRGYSDKTFKPTLNMTKAEFATIVYKCLEQEGKLEPIKNIYYMDDIKGHWAEKYIRAVTDGRYFNSMNKFNCKIASFCPENKVTRAEVATTIALMDGSGNQNTIDYTSNEMEDIENLILKTFGTTIVDRDNIYGNKEDGKRINAKQIRKGKMTDAEILNFMAEKMWKEKRDQFKENTENGLFSVTVTKEEIDQYSLNSFGKTIDYSGDVENKINEYLVSKKNIDGTIELFREKDYDKNHYRGVYSILDVMETAYVTDKNIYIVKLGAVGNHPATEGIQILIEEVNGKKVITEFLTGPLAPYYM